VTDPISLRADDGQHDGAVEALYERAFGPGRFAKAAARLREGNSCLAAFSFLALKGDEVVGACRLWPVQGKDGARALFLGPIAVDSAARSAGLGQRLVVACLAAVDSAHDDRSVILVGDLAYFGKMGFEMVAKGTITLPGPLDPARLLWRRASDAHAHAPSGLLSVPRAASQTN
jgi:predicted N-acetyltransferase YhbS